jgi:DNA-binding MarR family transcriptional regulator
MSETTQAPDADPRAEERPRGERSPWLRFIEAYKIVIDRMERLYAEAGAEGLVEHEVLWRLDREPERRMRMQDLAEALFLTKSGASRLIDRMELTDLVERQASNTDRRVVYAAITDKGEEALARSWDVFRTSYDEVFARNLEPHEVVEWVRLMVKMIEGNKRPSDPSDE